MADFSIKQNDTWPVLAFTLSDAAGTVDLTSATTIRLIMKLGSTTVIGVCDKDANQVTNRGKGTYTWIAADTATAGPFRAEFEITWSNGKVETFPNTGYKTIEIVGDLG